MALVVVRVPGIIYETLLVFVSWLFYKSLPDNNLKLLSSDEVHCCSQWGHDFRPDYKFLSLLKNVFPGVPLLGLTATATNAVLEDVQNMLGIEGCMIMHGNFDRPNLFYRVSK